MLKERNFEVVDDFEEFEECGRIEKVFNYCVYSLSDVYHYLKRFFIIKIVACLVSPIFTLIICFNASLLKEIFGENVDAIYQALVFFNFVSICGLLVYIPRYIYKIKKMLKQNKVSA